MGYKGGQKIYGSRW